MSFYLERKFEEILRLVKSSEQIEKEHFVVYDKVLLMEVPSFDLSTYKISDERTRILSAAIKLHMRTKVVKAIEEDVNTYNNSLICVEGNPENLKKNLELLLVFTCETKKFFVEIECFYRKPLIEFMKENLLKKE